MAPGKRLSSMREYTIGWIVALDKELAAAKAVLDEQHQKPEGFKKHLKDTNNYAWGRIGEHNIVIASLAAGKYGTVSAATTAWSMISSLPHLRFGLLAGIGAGIPRLDENIDIRLGDIVVSEPTGTSPGVVKYDLGKLGSGGQLKRVGCLNAPPEVLLKGVATLKANHLMEEPRVPEILEQMIQRYPKMGKPGPNGTAGFVYQGAENDRLYETIYLHGDTASAGHSAGFQSRSCARDPQEVQRKERTTEPMIHYGVIASGDSVVKHGVSRSRILQRLEDKCICFEMEAAGLMDNFPCLVIRGICDYADEHKNDQWQNYAAATAAAFAKELLEAMDGEDVERTSPIDRIMEELTEMKHTQKETRDIVQALDTSNHSQDIQRWLSPPDPSTNYHKALTQRQPGSGQWILRSTAYLEWKTQRNSFLWLHGIPGCGKTILSSTIIGDLMENANISAEAVSLPSALGTGRTRYKRVRDDEEDKVPQKEVKRQKTTRSGTEMVPRPHGIGQLPDSYSGARNTLYFYYDFNDTGKQSLESAIRSLVYQLYCNREDARKHLDSLYDSCRKGRSQPSMTSLCTAFQNMIQQAGETWIVFDALDECQTRQQHSSEGLLSWMEHLAASEETNVHLLVTSRPEQDIQSAIKRWAREQDTIPIKGDSVTKDIRSYVHTRVKKHNSLSRWRSRPKVLDEIEDTLAKNANGMFRWVSCQLDALENCLDLPALQNALGSLPKTLDGTYARIVANIPQQYEHYAHRLLQLLTFSKRPLRLEEAVDAIAVEVDSRPCFKPENRMPVPDEISKCCSSLVVIVSIQDIRRGVTRKVIQLAHFSVKEYLTSNRLDQTLLDIFKENIARTSIAKICLAYLSTLDKKLFPPGEIGRSFPFAKYCARYWMAHVRAGEYSAGLRRMILDFLLEPSWPFKNFCQLYNPDDEHKLYGSTTATPLYRASFEGLSSVVRDLLANGVDASARDGLLGSALQAASWRGHDEIVRMLLESGADTIIAEEQSDTKGELYGYALEAASAQGHKNIVQTLLNGGAKFDAQSACGHGTALIAASFEGHDDVVQVLLEKGANVHERNWKGATALQAACVAGQETIARTLLQRGADINAGGEEYDTPLYAASGRGHKELFQLLLDEGADVNAHSLCGETALYAAARGGQEMIVQTLLDKGAEINAQGGTFHTALQAAAEGGHERIFQMLLEKGAEIVNVQNAMDDCCRSILEAASYWEYESIVRILLDHGADPNAPGGPYGNALHAASEWFENGNIVQMLLERGAIPHSGTESDESRVEELEV